MGKSDVRPDGLEPWELIRDLRAISLGAQARLFVLECDEFVKRYGSLAEADKVRLRRIYSLNWRKLIILKEAQDRARHSMARGRLSPEARKVVDKKTAEVDLAQKKADDSRS